MLNLSQGKGTNMSKKFNLLVFAKFLFISFLFVSCKGADGGFAPDPSIATVVSPLAIAPASVTLAVFNSQSFSASGGTAPYSFSVFSGSGSVLSTTGNYTASSSAGMVTVRVTDALGQFSDAMITVNAALQISPASQSLSLNQTQMFTSTGGVSPFTFSLVSGAGTVDANSGLYTAPASPGSATIRVTDSRGNSSNASVNIYGALGISPTTLELAVNNIFTFSAAGGVGPYSFSVFSGTGVINASTGVYTAPASSGVATIRVTDSLGATASASVTINSALLISPLSQTTLINSSITFSQSGGVSPFLYSVIAGTGVIDANTGVYMAPASNGTATVRVTDNLGNISDASVTITTALSISPVSRTLAVNNTATFSAVGGTGPFTFSRFSGTGSVNASTGVYTAPASAGSAVVRVTDSLGAFADASVTVNAALAITPAAQTMGINGTLNFSATGGVVPYSYSVFSGGGSVNASTGVFTAPGTAGSTVVRVTDSNGNFVDSNVTVTAGLSISPASTTLAVNNTVTFVAANGATPYTFSILSGTGTVNATTGLYTAPATAGSAVVRVTDNLGATANANVTVNAALAITPATKTLAVNNVFTFTATGGVSPFTYSLFSGGGVINASTGAYTAPATAGSAVVRVTDGLGNVSNSNVTINAALLISPLTATISSTGTQAYSSTGGVSPFTYSIVSGPGSINASTGLYTAASAGSVSIRVSDSLGNTSDAMLTVNGPLSVTPTVAYVVIDSDLALSAIGGVSPYTYSIVSGLGVIDVATGIYTAASTTGSAVLRTTDSATPTAATVDTNVTIYNALTLSPISLTIAVNGTQTFTSTGGVGARTFSMFSGTGTINSTTGAYVAGPTAGTDLVHVTDTIGNIVEANVTVVSQLSITPPILKLPLFSTATFSAVLGSSPYTFSVFSGTGSINSGSGLYTAPAAVGTGSVRVTDNVMNTSDSTLTHIEPVEIASGSNHSCIRYNEGSVKCFGLGSSGQLGNGSTSNLAHTTTTLGGSLPFVNLGTGRTATAITAGISHSCALLDNASIKCWGQNTYGQLGIGNTISMGSGANQMGNSLPAVNLGAGRTATKVFAFGYVTCAILDNNTGKCWGRNSSGQLGKDDVTNRGTTASQMGDNLTAINLGSGLTPTKFAGGLDFTCALLNNATMKCFGNNRYGQLGVGSTVQLGDNAGEMAALAAISLGTGRTVVDIGAGYSHSCAILDNGTAKCWGRNNKGQVGIESTSNAIGTSPADMGNGLPIIPFTSFTPTKILGGNTMTCAANAAGAVRCWGLGSSGQLLVGSTANIGRSNNDIVNLTNVNFGTGLTAPSIGVGFYTVCAVTSDKRVKCWGNSLSGATGNGQTANNLGDVAGELGNSLPYMNH